MEKILVTPLIGMGDTLMTTPALRLIKSNHPDWQLTYFTISNSNYELLKGNPFIDNLLYYPLKSGGFFNGTLYILRKIFGKYSVCINFYPSNRAAYNLFAALSGAKKRIGNTYLHCNFKQINWLKNRTFPEDPGLHCVEENIKLLSFLGIRYDSGSLPSTEIFLSSAERSKGTAFRSSIEKKLVGVHAGTSTFKHQDRRRWSKDKFIELINRLPEYQFALFGTREEEEINDYILANVNDRSHITIINNRPLREAISIIGTCDAFVSNDSGLMHIAAAMKVPVVALIGPTNPAFIYPWNTKHEIVRSGIECSPCFYYSPRPLRCIHHIDFKCMTDITVDMAEEALKKIMA
jgi:lipopolysaccharide heptosyltransferase II